ncbi:hypothetical protein TrispH2_011753 [Trichoplax sp. H2]|uniref:Expressed protein n=1 Tax=Trichoplax adhaerens TaxID=10228 RepID=B3SDU6_TRIAD|nr:expressed protein [Trichoplax adhaerens]EDV19102.1 expressed protein [Trichoplax adhaerens]RDD35943.1 hypothetical protein TrispH2_011753 [Trichoplax sp. H2]|eukprot:XP_002118415.1 expressed protein [Trichoplax adhaerens]
MNSKLVVLASLLLIVVVCSAKEDQAKQNTDDDKEQYDFAITSRMEEDDGDVVRFNERDQEIEELKEDLQHLKKAWWGRRRRRRRRRRSTTDTNVRFLGKKKSN